MSGLPTGWAETIPVSALNQYAYCPRRCALIFMDGEFEDNIHTQRGTDEHDRADQTFHVCETEGVRLEYALPVWSRHLGLSGRCDVVEFHPDGKVYPVEYKHGKKQKWLNDDLQLAAQAVCLEEMLNIGIERGAIFHKGSQRRREVEFTPALRAELEKTANAIHHLLTSGHLPPPINNHRCPECSLKNICLPSVVADKKRNRKAARELFEVEP
ncbi:MAG: CRISPR-associated protein Cas4 [Syntrophobacteraceae bacterium]|nr:CRISPR-associated protein Cas4 [Syntrophobacteraceae bacterium]